MQQKKTFKNFIDWLESLLPMSVTSLMMFLFIIYLFFIVGKSILTNYNSNKDLENQEKNIQALQNKINLMENQINYYKTTSFKEKEAREKLGYKAPGESVIALPLDKEEDKIADDQLGEVNIKTPNYSLWWSYIVEGKGK